MSPATPLETIAVWKQVTPELEAELIAFWTRHEALGDPATAPARAAQAVCIARDADGAVCAVGTALLRVIPRLRQPTYYYRQFFAESFRGQKLTAPFIRQAKQVLQDYNRALPAPESIGMLIELENKQLEARYNHGQDGSFAFIGYSPRGLQLKVSYFEGATLFPPAPLQRRAAAGARRN